LTIFYIHFCNLINKSVRFHGKHKLVCVTPNFWTVVYTSQCIFLLLLFLLNENTFLFLKGVTRRLFCRISIRWTERGRAACSNLFSAKPDLSHSLHTHNATHTHTHTHGGRRLSTSAHPYPRYRPVAACLKPNHSSSFFTEARENRSGCTHCRQGWAHLDSSGVFDGRHAQIRRVIDDAAASQASSTRGRPSGQSQPRALTLPVTPFHSRERWESLRRKQRQSSTSAVSRFQNTTTTHTF